MKPRDRDRIKYQDKLRAFKQMSDEERFVYLRQEATVAPYLHREWVVQETQMSVDTKIENMQETYKDQLDDIELIVTKDGTTLSVELALVVTEVAAEIAQRNELNKK